MRTFLLTWNPGRGDGWKELPYHVERRRNRKPSKGTWSCGRSLQIRKNDRLFMLRQGVEPRGIVAVGHALDDAYRQKRWSKDLKSLTSCHVDCRIEDILDPESQPILARQTLLRGAFRNAKQLLDTRVSGREIPHTVVSALVRQWNEFRRPSRSVQVPRGEAEVSKAVAGAGFGDPVINREVERAAIRFVAQSYRNGNWEVESVESDRCGFDLRCRRRGQIRHLEVKGIRGDGLSFILTSNELKRAKSDPFIRVCIVTSALGRHAALHQYSGPEFQRAFDVRPYQFFARRRT